MNLPENPWAESVDEVVDRLDVSAERGLDEQEADRRRHRWGPNALETSKPKSAWEILIHQFMSLIVGLLVVAAIVAFFFGEYVEMVAIAAVVLINAAIGFVTELRAVRSMEALKQIAEVASRVLRNGEFRSISARELVPGDVVSVEAGNLVGADMRLLESSELECDESVLTGESFPVEKSTERLDEDTPLADRENMLFRGTAVTRGHGCGVVVGTGMQTEVGRITELVGTAQQRETPLEERLDELGKRLVWVCLGLALMVGGVGLTQGKELFVVIETAIALAVATIPEGLPIVATLALARGMWRMADRNALVRNLAVVETLGSASLILTDKTGTLTKNQMTVTRLEDSGGPIDIDWHGDEAGAAVEFTRDGAPLTAREAPAFRAALEVGALCNNERLKPAPEPSGSGPESRTDPKDPPKRRIGEPMEMALLDVAAAAGIDPPDLRKRYPRLRETPFDASTKMMATFHRVAGDAADAADVADPAESGGGIRVAVKGAPEAVIEVCTHVEVPNEHNGGDNVRRVELDEETRERWLQMNLEWGESGLRVLALAKKTVDDPEAEPYEDLTLVGLVGMVDPPRTDVRAALEDCRSAGIRVVMLTGDQPGTAMHVARQLDMVREENGREVTAIHGSDIGDVDALPREQVREVADHQVFSRVTPEQKFDIVKLHQQAGQVVAMTGDGVNDAPALMQSDIGIAMGRRGTQVAQEAADMVLGDDAFSTIVAAVEQGRVIFENIRKFVVYLLSCNVSELMVITAASLLFSNAPLPLTALQILYLNLVTDVFPALALGFGEGSPTILDRPPRERTESILTNRHWLSIASWGALLTVSVLGAFYLAYFHLEMDPDRAVTVSFLTLALSQLWHVFNMRSRGTGRLINDVTKNPFIWGALAICVVLLLVAVFLPPLAHALDVVNPGWSGWGIALGISFLPALLGLFRK